MLLWLTLLAAAWLAAAWLSCWLTLLAPVYLETFDFTADTLDILLAYDFKSSYFSSSANCLFDIWDAACDTDASFDCYVAWDGALDYFDT